MRERGITDEQLAGEAKCCVRLVRYFKAGRPPTKQAIVERIARVLRVQAETLSAPIARIVAGAGGAVSIIPQRSRPKGEFHAGGRNSEVPERRRHRRA